MRFPRPKRPTRVDTALATALYMMNILDCFLTLWAVRLAGPSMELNSMMRFLLSLGEGAFIGVKLLGGLVLTLALLFYPIPRKFSMALVVATVIYFIFTSYHLWGVWRACG